VPEAADAVVGGGSPAPEEPAKKDEKPAKDEMVFELFDAFDDEFDDLSWDVDLADSADEPAADTAAAAGRETVLDKAGLEFATAGAPSSPAAEPAPTATTAGAGAMPATADTAAAQAVPAKARFGRRQTVIVAVMVIILSLAIWGAVLLWKSFAIEMDKHLSIVGLESRNLIFPSGKRVVVIRGRIHNTAPKPVSDLVIRGELLDRENNVLAVRRTAGGVTFSAAEMENLDDETVKALEDPSAFVPPAGGELPFMLLFYNYPSEAASFQVILEHFSVGKKGGK
jgi:hypothetical protein